MTCQSTRIATALALAGALALGATSASLARGGKAAVRLAKVPADATGYFFYPANYVGDNYVYDPLSIRRQSAARTPRH